MTRDTRLRPQWIVIARQVTKAEHGCGIVVPGRRFSTVAFVDIIGPICEGSEPTTSGQLRIVEELAREPGDGEAGDRLSSLGQLGPGLLLGPDPAAISFGEPRF